MFKKIIFVLGLIALSQTLRLSEKKCQEYKNLIKTEYCYGRSCRIKKTEYECHNVGHIPLVVGGEKAKPGEFPHMAAIGWENEDGSVEFACGGTLVSNKFVLTAAHCLTERDTSPSFVRLGTVNLADSGIFSAQQDVGIKREIIHPQYESIGNTNDIALLELAREVTFHERYLRPACLRSIRRQEKKIVATGWGQTKSFSNTSDHLMRVSLPIVRSDKCEDSGIAARFNGRTQICAGGVENKDTCKGDSGGPIQLSHNDAPCVYDVVGLTSYGNPLCGKVDEYAVYTNINPYLGWIEKNVWSAEWKEWNRKGSVVRFPGQ